MHSSNYNHKRSQSNYDVQSNLQTRIAGLVEDEYYFQPKSEQQQLIGQPLFLIPEQNDLISSVEQTQESSQKSQQIQREINTSNKKRNYDQKQKQDENQSACSNLIQQIQQIVSGTSSIKDITQKTLNSERPNKVMSFTKELQKKQGQNYLQYQNSRQSEIITSNITPDRKRIPSTSTKVTSQQQKSDNSSNDKFQKSQNVSLFNALFKQETKKKSFDKQEEFDKINNYMKRIETDISYLKQRQDKLDQNNQIIQDQLKIVVSESRRQSDFGQKQLIKLEVLETLTKKNQDSILELKNILTKQNKQKKNDQNDINFGNLQQSELTDLHRKFQDFKCLNNKFCY